MLIRGRLFKTREGDHWVSFSVYLEVRNVVIALKEGRFSLSINKATLKNSGLLFAYIAFIGI